MRCRPAQPDAAAGLDPQHDPRRSRRTMPCPRSSSSSTSHIGEASGDGPTSMSDREPTTSCARLHRRIAAVSLEHATPPVQRNDGHPVLLTELSCRASAHPVRLHQCTATQRHRASSAYSPTPEPSCRPLQQQDHIHYRFGAAHKVGAGMGDYITPEAIIV